jgi:predicted nucleic acid-binding protein
VILLDTSAWVEFDRATGSEVHVRVRELMAGGGELAVTEPVVAEVVAGAGTDAREVALRRLLGRFDLLRFDGAADFDAGATIYRRCRAAGITPRGLLDCVIAAVAIRHDAPVLAHDVDLARIAEITSLQLDAATLRPG